ncbi:hypothetical protein JAAARDRAFT_201035 [Jaapia argillacea MUCL 33604]|uniref:Uncharacterized protein n=1 Tax=Jaapia argillacea MUCL 33604 TaxID=933084 RepID=A0A067P389_9AGAM|nr:hypothetical protein JAAARDRAFT_201035 [Jaapia argillacea MUCL 33604]
MSLKSQMSYHTDYRLWDRYRRSRSPPRPLQGRAQHNKDGKHWRLASICQESGRGDFTQRHPPLWDHIRGGELCDHIAPAPQKRPLQEHIDTSSSAGATTQPSSSQIYHHKDVDMEPRGQRATPPHALVDCIRSASPPAPVRTTPHMVDISVESMGEPPESTGQSMVSFIATSFADKWGYSPLAGAWAHARFIPSALVCLQDSTIICDPQSEILLYYLVNANLSWSAEEVVAHAQQIGAYCRPVFDASYIRSMAASLSRDFTSASSSNLPDEFHGGNRFLHISVKELQNPRRLCHNYLKAVASLLGRPHMRRVWKEGGLLWRIAIQYGSPDLGMLSLMGPSDHAILQDIVHYEDCSNLVDDAVTQQEQQLLLGYVDNGSSLWPPLDLFEKWKDWKGFWTPGLEKWFQGIHSSVTMDRMSPLTPNGWKKKLKGFYFARTDVDLTPGTLSHAQDLCFKLRQAFPGTLSSHLLPPLRWEHELYAITND